MSDPPTPCPFPARTIAFLLDQLLVLLAVAGPLVALGVDVLAPGTFWPVFLALMLAAFSYHTAFEYATGTTPGKRALGLRVVADDGRPLEFRAAVVRNALRLIDGLGYWTVATVIIFYRGDGKRLGDVVGRTLVVRA